MSGISGVTARSFDIDRVSDTQVTVELTFDGTDLRPQMAHSPLLSEAGAIAGYNGAALTTQLSVSASIEDDTGVTPPVTTVVPLGVSQVGDVLAPGDSCTYPGTDTEFSVLHDGRGQFLFFTSGNGLNINNTVINGQPYTLVAKKLTSDSWGIEKIGDSGGQTPDPPQQPQQPGDTGGTPTLSASITSPLTEATLNGSVVTLTLSGGTYVDSGFSVALAITVSGIDRVTFRAVGCRPHQRYRGDS